MRRAALFGILALVLALPAKAAVVEEFTVEDWSGLALSDDETGRLASCAIYSKYQNGATLIFIRLAEAGWTLAVGHDDWALTEDSEYPVRYKVDREAFVDATSIALNTDQIGIALPADDPLLAQIRRGKLLTLSFQGKDFGFELSNSADALKGAEDCIERHRNLGRDEVAGAGEAEEASEAPSLVEKEEAAAADSQADSGEASMMGDRQSFGPWVVTATDDGDGNFVNCTAFGVHGDDQLILSYRPDEVWEFGLYRAQWALDPNQTYYLWYNVDAPADGEGVIKRPVEAAEPTRIFFEVSAEEDIMSRIENGRDLNVQLRGVAMDPEGYSYPLDRASEALAATRECTRMNAEAAQQAASGPAEAETAEAEPDEGVAEEQADGAAPPKVLPTIGVERIEDLEVPGWDGAAFSDDAGAFTHCAIEAEYENGTTLAFLRTAGGPLLMTLRRADWSLETGAWLPVRYRFNAAEPATIATEGLAIDASTMGINLGVEDMITMQLRTVPALVVETQEKSISFDISDVAPGLDAIDACAERRRAGSESAAPGPDPAAGDGSSKKKGPGAGPAAETPDAGAEPGPQPDRAVAAPDSPEERVEAAGYTTALLLRSGYPGHVILTGTNTPEALAQRDAAWQIGTVFGTTDIVHDYTTARIKEDVISSDTSECGGPLKSEDIAGDASAGSVFFSSFCDGAESDFYVFYVVIPREGGGHYSVALIDRGDGATARQIGEKLFETAEQG